MPDFPLDPNAFAQQARTIAFTSDGFDPIPVATHLEAVDASEDERTFLSPVRLYVGTAGDLVVSDAYGNDVAMKAVAVGWLPFLVTAVDASAEGAAEDLVAGHCKAAAQLEAVPEE